MCCETSSLRTQKSQAAAIGKSCRVDGAPKIQIVHGALLIAHVDVEGKEIDGCSRAPTQHFGEGGKVTAIHVGVEVVVRVCTIHIGIHDGKRLRKIWG